jgi:hypothetical protein
MSESNGRIAMEIRRCACRRSGAETLTVVPEVQPRLEWDRTNNRLLLYAEDRVSPRDEGSRYDYVVSLSQADLDLVRTLLAANGGRI